MPVRTAVIGAGSMGNVHLQQLNLIPDVEVVALVDPSEAAVRRTADTHRVPRTFGDIKTMLAEVKPAYVVVASPMPYHVDDAVAVYEAGAHALVEKPLAMNVEEAERIKDAAVRAGKLFTMGFQLRQQPGNLAVRQHVAEGKLGTIYHSRVWGGHVMGYPWGRYFHRKSVSMGGVIANTTVHPLDVLYWIIGEPEPTAVSASAFCKLTKMPDPPINFEGTIDEVTVEDFAHAHVRFADGSSLSIEGNWLMHQTDRVMGYELYGSLGLARSVTPHVELEKGRELTPLTFDPDITWGECTRREHIEFLAAMRGEREPVVSFHQALAVQKIMCGLYASVEQGSEVRL